MKVSLLGTGLMGRPMAERLLRSGYDVVVYNRTPEKVEPLTNLGAEIAETAGKAVGSGMGGHRLFFRIQHHQPGEMRISIKRELPWKRHSG